MAEFTFSKWVKDNSLPSAVAQVLESEGFDQFEALIHASEKDLKDLKIGRGHAVVLRTAVQRLQKEAGGGPALQQVEGDNTGGRPLDDLLGRLSLGGRQDVSARGPATGEVHALRIVDFLSPALVAEEEVALGGGLSIKVNSKPKLDKVSPALWIAANSRIQTTLMQDHSFDVRAYAKYTEMIGELGSRYTWQSVLTFDDEYRQRQAANGFPWGTEAPHLATVVLRDRVTQQQHPPQRKAAGGNDRRPRPTGPAGKEVCMQYNRGACTFGTRCVFEHVCATCFKDHPARDHATPAGSSGHHA